MAFYLPSATARCNSDALFNNAISLNNVFALAAYALAKSHPMTTKHPSILAILRRGLLLEPGWHAASMAKCSYDEDSNGQ
jgi:hypothetical protein